MTITPPNGLSPVVADLYTHDYWDPEGREVYVEGIHIDYAYKAGQENTITIEVESLQLDDAAAFRAGGAVSFTPPSGTPSDSGAEIIRGRAEIPARSSGSGAGFRIHCSDWTGITLRKITADVRFTGTR